METDADPKSGPEKTNADPKNLKKIPALYSAYVTQRKFSLTPALPMFF